MGKGKLIGCRAVSVAGLALLVGCADAPNPGASDPSLPGAGTLPASAFPLSNARVLTQSGVNTAIVEVSLPSEFPQNDLRVRSAASQWCGRPAMASPLSTDRSRLKKRRRYLVRCL